MNVTLRDGRKMPQLGYGVWQIEDDEAERCTLEALRVGYRSIDTARIYNNESGVGRAIAACGVPRDELFVTTKLWNADQGHDEALRAFDASLARLGLDALDLYLIHWPAPRKDRYVESWKALVQLAKDGRARSIGVSNFGADHLRRIIDATGVVPAVNQIELHPRFTQEALRAVHAELGIQTESWSPLGQGKLMDDPAIVAIAKKHARTPAQVILRWHLQHGFVAIPKSATPSRIAENFDLEFTLDDADVRALDALDARDGRIGPDPMTATF